MGVRVRLSSYRKRNLPHPPGDGVCIVARLWLCPNIQNNAIREEYSLKWVGFIFSVNFPRPQPLHLELSFPRFSGHKSEANQVHCKGKETEHK